MATWADPPEEPKARHWEPPPLTDAERAMELTDRISGLQRIVEELAVERCHVYQRLQRAGWSTRRIARHVGTSQPAVVEAMKLAPYHGEEHGA
jgi:hypothetical protein